MDQVSIRAEAITRRTYNRPLDADGTIFETWEQTAHRATVEHQRRLWENAGGNPSEEELEELHQLVLNRKALVSGRTLWLGGTDYSMSRACSQFNCAFTRAQTVYQFVDVFWLLLNGCGVGFRPQAGTLHGFLKPIRDLEVISSQHAPSYKGREENIEIMPDESNGYHWTVGIGDSAQAWAKSLGKLLNPPHSIVNKLTIDASEPRGPGERLNGYGWICNGAKPLEVAYRHIFDILNSKAGDLLDEIDLLDVTNHLGTVLSSRRSAQIGLMDYGHPRWEQFATAKREWWLNGNNHRQQSNNSLVFWWKPEKSKIRELMQLIWDSGGSEPGFINGESARRRAPWFDGVNPSLRAGTKVLTTGGIVPIEGLEGKKFFVKNLDGKVSAAACQLSGQRKQLWRVVLVGGHEYYATAEHRWPIYLNGRYIKLQTSELQSGDYLPTFRADHLFEGTEGTYEDGFFLGWMLGDGWLTVRSDDGCRQVGLIVSHEDIASGVKAKLLAYLRSLGCQANFHPSTTGASEELNTIHRGINAVLDRFGCRGKQEGLPDATFCSATEDFRRGLLDAIFSADGSVEQTGRDRRIRLPSAYEKLAKDVSELLGFYGIKTTIIYREWGNAEFPNGKQYDRTYEQWLLSINDYRSLEHFHRLVTLSNSPKQRRIVESITRSSTKRLQNDGRIKIKLVEKLDLYEDVWDIAVDDKTHCFQLAHCVTGNCGEILLSSNGFCNLTTVAVSKFYNNFAALLRSLYIMGRANYRQTCVNLNDGVLSPEWGQTNDALRLCGMSMTGIAQAPWLTDYQIKRLRDAAVTGCYSMAGELGLPRPKLVTCIKPEGTGSKIMDVTEGVHNPPGKYIINWVNFADRDSIIEILQAAGYRSMQNPNDPSGVLIAFPVEYPGCQFTVADGKQVTRESAVTQLNRYRRWNTLWSDHNTSITISWDISEVDEIVDWLDRHWDDYVAVSWLKRIDPTQSAEDLGYKYLPQEVVVESAYREYTERLKAVDWSRMHGIHDVDAGECSGGSCPVK